MSFLPLFSKIFAMGLALKGFFFTFDVLTDIEFANIKHYNYYGKEGD